MKKILFWLQENVHGVFCVFLLVLFVVGIAYIFLDFKRDVAAKEQEMSSIHTETFVMESVKLESVSEGELQGASVLSIGNVQGSFGDKTYYTGYRLDDDGGKVFCKMDAEQVVLYETLEDGEQVYVEIDENGYSIQEIRLYAPAGYFQK